MDEKALNMVSLMIIIIGIPAISFAMALIGVIMFPSSNSPQVLLFIILVFLLMGVLIHPILGNMFIKMFIRYVKDEETFHDEEIAKKSRIFSLLILFFLLSLIWDYFRYF